MKYVLLYDAKVNLAAGTVVDVNEQEAFRLSAFGIGKPVEEKTEAPKKAKKKG